MTTLAGSNFAVEPGANLTLSAFDFPFHGSRNRRGLATGARQVVWCCQNTTTYVTINTTLSVTTDSSFDLLELLKSAIKQAEDGMIRNGNTIVRGGTWTFGLLDKPAIITAVDMGDPNSDATFRHLTWPVMRDGMKALNDFVTTRDLATKNLAHTLRGWEVGINSAFLGQVGQWEDIDCYVVFPSLQLSSPSSSPPLINLQEHHSDLDVVTTHHQQIHRRAHFLLVTSAPNQTARVSIQLSLVLANQSIPRSRMWAFLLMLPVSAPLRAMHNPSAVDQPAGTTYVNSSINPAPHFFYFFENDKDVADFVADIFRAVAACADGHDCPMNIVLCGDRGNEGACSSPPGRYGYVRDPNQYVATLNHNPKGGGVVFMCDAGLALPRNPIPCSTAGGADSLGYALLGQLLQVDVITRPDVTFLQQKANWQNITDFHTDGSPWTLNELGFGTSGNGLRGKGIANMENYRRFASWSWDLGFGGQPWTGETCEEKFDDVIRSQGLVPFG
ncbi:MAG: hypothetical protein Q9170_007242 [Blastenia crenularia]